MQVRRQIKTSSAWVEQLTSCKRKCESGSS